MAPPPKVKAISRESIPDAPAWFDQFLLVLNNTLSATASALDRRLTRKENMLAGERLGIAFATPPNSTGTLLADAEWREVGEDGEPAFENNWVNYDATAWESAAFRADALGWCHLRGLVKNGTVGANIFTLPAAYRPALRFVHGVYSEGGATSSTRVDILAAGGVFMVQPVAGTTYLTLNGLSWYIGCPPFVVPVKWDTVTTPRHVQASLKRRDGADIQTPWSFSWSLNQGGQILLSFQGLTASTEYLASIAYE